MTPTDADYYLDAAIMAVMDGVSNEAVMIAATLGRNGLEFNAAIWAAIRLQEITKSPPSFHG